MKLTSERKDEGTVFIAVVGVIHPAGRHSVTYTDFDACEASRYPSSVLGVHADMIRAGDDALEDPGRDPRRYIRREEAR